MCARNTMQKPLRPPVFRSRGGGSGQAEAVTSVLRGAVPRRAQERAEAAGKQVPLCVE